MEIKDLFIRVLKIGYRKITKKKFLPPECDCDRDSANIKIFNLLNSQKPCLISRFGTTEINCVNNYLSIIDNKSFWVKCKNYIIDNTHTPWWNRSHFYFMNIYSGIFPESEKTAEDFSKLYLKDIPEIDLLGSHQYYEKFMPLRKDVVKVQLECLYPFFSANPWTKYLKNKKVLVIHPFEDTIKYQYDKKENLFSLSDILPDFQLITYKAVQSIAGNKTEFSSWFEALEFMEKDIAELDFDIAIIGCGAYGLPLGAFIKRLGKQAIHLGGGTQLLFGILGKRWVEQYDDVLHYRPEIEIDIDYRKLFNENWIYPLESDVPNNSNKVENACYWK